MTSPLLLSVTKDAASEGAATREPIILPPKLDHLPVASKELLQRRALLERVDRKFVTTWSCVNKFLAGLGDSYHVLPSDGRVWARYETCYFDTNSLDAFHEHVRGRRPRFKIRMRRHVERKCAFLEIKRKGINDRTDKYRMERDYSLTDLTTEELEFIRAHTPFDPARLEPSVWTNFCRATLLGAETEERITIDLDLRFERNGHKKQNENLAIIELKQRRLANSTPAARCLHELHIRERSLSKYCAGVANLHESARPQYRQMLLKRLARLEKWNGI